MAYTFGHSPRTAGRKHKNTASSQGMYSFDNSSEVSHGVTEFNDGHSLTYSASSSQAGESTDSSVADIEFLRMVDKDQHIHVLERQAASFRRKEAAVLGVPAAHSQRSFRSENSVADSSLGYSTDEGIHDDYASNVHENAAGQMFVSTKDGARRVSSSSG
jgi:hypothetical protein